MTLVAEPPVRPPIMPVADAAPDPWEDVKRHFEAALRKLVPEAEFTLVREANWVGECPSPSAKVIANGLTRHQPDRS